MCQVSLVTEVLADLVLAQRNLLSHCRSRSRLTASDLVLKRARRASIPVWECNPEMERDWTAPALLAISVRLRGFRVNSGPGQGREPGLYRESTEKDPDGNTHFPGESECRERAQQGECGHRRHQASLQRGTHALTYGTPVRGSPVAGRHSPILQPSAAPSRYNPPEPASTRSQT